MNLKIFTITALMLAALLSGSASAQRTDGFFHNNDEIYNRDGEGISWGSGLTTQDPTPPAWLKPMKRSIFTVTTSTIR